MRELVHLSERTLSEFRQERRRGFRVREIGVPEVGQVGIEQPYSAGSSTSRTRSIPNSPRR